MEHDDHRECGFEHGLDEAEDLVLDAYELFAVAMECLSRRQFRKLAEQMHLASKKHRAVAGLYDAIGKRAMQLGLN